MRDISRKTPTLRTAEASAVVRVSPGTIDRIRKNTVPKGDPRPVARVAAIQAAKQTSQIIPFCHPLPIDHADCAILLEKNAIRIDTTVTAIHKTGVEMEALTAASVAALTIYDMLKPIDDELVIGEIRLVKKRGGKSDWLKAPSGLRTAVLVFSDSTSKGSRRDSSGKHIVDRLIVAGVRRPYYKVLPDDYELIVDELAGLADKRKMDLVITTGGTGLGPRDTAPEATMSVIDRPVPGIAETIRMHGQERVPTAMLSRNTAGLRGKTLIVNLPGSLKGAGEGLDAILAGVFHAFGVIRGGGHARVRKQ